MNLKERIRLALADKDCPRFSKWSGDPKECYDNDYRDSEDIATYLVSALADIEPKECKITLGGYDFCMATCSKCEHEFTHETGFTNSKGEYDVEPSNFCPNCGAKVITPTQAEAERALKGGVK